MYLTIRWIPFYMISLYSINKTETMSSYNFFNKLNNEVFCKPNTLLCFITKHPNIYPIIHILWISSLPWPSLNGEKKWKTRPNRTYSRKWCPMFACPELPSHLSGGAHKLAPNIHKTTVNGHFYRNNCIFFVCWPCVQLVQLVQLAFWVWLWHWQRKFWLRSAGVSRPWIIHSVSLRARSADAGGPAKRASDCAYARNQ